MEDLWETNSSFTDSENETSEDSDDFYHYDSYYDDDDDFTYFWDDDDDEDELVGYCTTWKSIAFFSFILGGGRRG
jgi:hypothetical protein